MRSVCGMLMYTILQYPVVNLFELFSIGTIFIGMFFVHLFNLRLTCVNQIHYGVSCINVPTSGSFKCFFSKEQSSMMTVTTVSKRICEI